MSIVGTDIYHPTQDQLTGAEIAFCGDEIRSLKDSNYLVLECQAQAFKYWTPYPGQLRQHAYSHLASGATGVMYWNWHSIHNGYETYWKGVLSHDLDTNPTYEEAGQIGREWAQFGKHLVGFKKTNQVALVIDNQSLNAFKWFPIDRDLSYNDVVRWMYDALYEMNIECDVVFAESVDLSKYKMVVTPALYSASEETITKFRNFVNQGGTLISSFKSFVCDEHLSVYHDKQPHGLHDCFGMSYNQFTEPSRVKVQGKSINYWAELIKVEGAECLAAYEHPYWHQYAGITKNSYGKGTAYYIGCYTDKETLKEIYQKAVVSANLQDSLPNVVWPLIIRQGLNAAGKKLYYIFNYSENNMTFEWPYGTVTDIFTGKTICQGELIQCTDWGVNVLEGEQN